MKGNNTSNMTNISSERVDGAIAPLLNSALYERIGYSFNNEDLFIEAVTHSSFSNENRLSLNYERLEFLGDAVIQLIVTEYLTLKYKDFDEGLLSKYRGFFVSEEFLSKIARVICLGKFIKLGKGEQQNGGSDKSSLLCDIFESLVAAIYLDGGYDNARKMVVELMVSEIDKIIAENDFFDSKTELQKFTQQKYDILPDYRIVEERGPEHEKTFFIEVYINGNLQAEGSGRSKKKAEQDAAKKALHVLINVS